MHKLSVDLSKYDQNAFFLLMENTYNYMDFEKYIEKQLEKAEGTWPKQQMSVSLNNIYDAITTIKNTLKTFSDTYDFFHGDFHSGNVKVKASKAGNGNRIDHVKLFDFDFSVVLNNNTSPIISKNISLYNLRFDQKNMFERNENNVTTNLHDDLTSQSIKRFCYLFDYFRLWLSVIFSILRYDKKLQYDVDSKYTRESPESAFLHYMNTSPHIQKGSVKWHDHFRGDTFYNHIYCKIVSDCQYQPPSVTEKVQEVQSLVERLNNLEIGSEDESSDFSEGGGSDSHKNKKKSHIKSYTRLGYHKIKTKNHDDSITTNRRVVWTLNNRYYVLDKHKNYVKIKKRSISFSE
jgi:hypothetical protein